MPHKIMSHKNNKQSTSCGHKKNYQRLKDTSKMPLKKLFRVSLIAPGGSAKKRQVYACLTA